jgi:phosphohistidine phosphatase
MGRFLERIRQLPDLAITSSAVRARTTLELAAEGGGWKVPSEVTRDLYGASPESVLARLQALDAGVESVLLVGHEPTFSELAGRLTGGSRVKFPTAALARIDFPVDDWRGLDFGRGILLWIVTPKLLQKAGLGE